MTPSEIVGEPLTQLLLAHGPNVPREPLYRALLEEPLCMAHLAHDAPPGPALRLSFGETIRLVESPALRVPVTPLYASGAAMAEAGRGRNYWPDGIERGAVLEKGAAFPLLRGHPGALIVADDDHAAAVDAGEIAALADRKLPDDYAADLRALLKRNKGREVARTLARRPLYVLGHPHGGLLMFQREIPAFLHLANADRFAARIAAQSGEKAEHGLVAATDLFQNCFRGKLDLIIDPGPHAMVLRPADFRI